MEISKVSIKYTSSMVNDEEKIGLKVVTVTVVVFLMLAGLYWGGKKFLLVPGDVDGPGNNGVVVSLEACSEEKISRDLQQALVDTYEHGKRVCGLDISGQNFFTLSIAFSNLESLVLLDVSDNFIQELPDWIGEMRHLLSLDVGNNNLTTLPAEIRLLQNLEVLDLRGNPLPQADVEKARRQLPNAKVHF
jgi:Leucine-rich repeat (LRR) protein